MNLITWVLFGIIMGIISYAFENTSARKPISAFVILGIIGSLLGGSIAHTIFGIGVTGFNIVSFVIAIWGTVLLLIIGKSLTIFR